MKNKLALLLWEGLSQDEKKRLALMVDSPYHNQQEEVQKLYDYLAQCDTSSREPTEAEAYRFITGSSVYDDARMRHYMSWFTGLIEDFFLWENIRDRRMGKTMILEEYQRRKMKKPFDMLKNRLIKKLESSGLRDSEYHHVMKDMFAFSLEMEDTRNPDVQQAMQRVTNEIDIYYLIEKLKSAVSLLSHSKLYKVEYDLGLLGSVLKVAGEKGYLALPEVEVYYYVFLTQADPEDEQHFRGLQEAIHKAKNKLPLHEERRILLLAINYCIGKTNLGKHQYVIAGLGLYQNGLENGILLEDGVLSPYTYKNICSLALLQGEYDWALAFIHQYKKHLEESLRESYFTYNLARIHLKQKKFVDVISLLNTVYIKDVFTQLATRVIQIQAGYEQGDLELVDYQLDNFRQILHRKELLASHKKNYGNFVKLARRLVRLNIHQLGEIEQLETEITKMELLVEREWLLEKTALLKNMSGRSGG